LDASDSTKEAGLDQKARLRIFSGAGFDINTETGYYTAEGAYEIVPTTVLLSNGETGTVLGRAGDDYSVTYEGKQHTVPINQIEKCYDGAANQISCPMIMMLPSTGGRSRRRSRRSKSKSKSRRQTLKKHL
jgi:hypothetical protein